MLDGAILVLCAVAGVQSQSITVDRQMRRYNVPRLAFVNKMDRAGANPFRVAEQLRRSCSHNAVMIQIPIGARGQASRASSISSTMKAFYFDGDNGETIREEDDPGRACRTRPRSAREEMLDAVSMFADELIEAILEEQGHRPS